MDTRNFFCLCHGSPNAISDNTHISITPQEVSNCLMDSPVQIAFGTMGMGWSHSYRFVFLYGCETTIEPTWSRASGIFDNITPEQADRSPDRVHAFVGLDGSLAHPISGVGGEDYCLLMASFEIFFALG